MTLSLCRIFRFKRGITMPAKKASWEFLLFLAKLVLGPVLKMVSKAIREKYEDVLVDLYLKSLETDNPWDDFFAGFLLDILDIPRPMTEG